MARKRIGLHPAAADAVRVLGQQVRLARRAKNWTAADLAAATGVSPRTISSIETGSSAVSIGNVLNVAAIAGVPLFGVDDPAELTRMRLRGEERIALIPTRVRHPAPEEDDDGLDF
ncbi:helix-turn-helix transcriptional regulator [Nocardia sp. NPDC058666]|uniref:helix-turn-helix transcriptional regulator n=1 Tax=unclassified Nocardia TaxID=2637762 RepID=UPI003648174D